MKATLRINNENNQVFLENISASQSFQLNAYERLHYLDQSFINPQLKNVDTAVICVHGNPSWSWYYRHYFYPEQKHRIIAVDHLGMGLSSKVSRYVSVEEHAVNLYRLVESLKIRKVHLVVHDWGGVIGLSAFMNKKIEILSVIGMNTSFFHRKNFPWRIFLATRSPWNSLLNKQLGVFSKAASYMTTHNALDTSTRGQYQFPYQTPEQRQGIVNFLQDIPWFKSSKNFHFVKNCEDYMRHLSIPMMAIWGLQDFCFDQSYMDYWKTICPQLEKHGFTDAGHWCFEDKTSEILKLSNDFWSLL